MACRSFSTASVANWRWGAEVPFGFLDQALPAPRLPVDLADVLHLLDPQPQDPQSWTLLYGLLASLAILGLLSWLSRRKKPMAQPIRPAPRPPKVDTASVLARHIDALRTEILDNGRFRQGCHRLAVLLRQRGEAVEAKPMTRWTSGQIDGFLGDVPMSRVIHLLTDLQFGRKDPDQSDFEGVCELARDAGEGRRW